MIHVYGTPQMQPDTIKPVPQYSKTFKVTAGLILVVCIAALAKFLSVWGHDYLLKAQDSICDRLWLNESRRMS
ncbi:MAG: hypothetical protein FOGNACKC_02047 [Anaerolineae bacterium]|nr:hypothetical protein [Anaerolineae bacterium]